MPRYEKLHDRLLVLLVRLLSLLPLFMLHLIADLAVVLLYDIFRHQRRLVFDNLSSVFPEYPEKEIKRIARKSYSNACHVLFESIKTLRMDRRQLLKRIRIENPEVILKYLNKQQSVVAVAAHQCNWEWSLTACAAYFDYPIDAVYRPLNNPALNALALDIRGRFGSNLVPTDKFLNELRKMRSQVRITALISDLGPRPKEKKYWSTFLGRDTAFYPGPEQITRFMDSAVVFVAMIRTSRGHYRVHFESLADSAAGLESGEIMQRYVRVLEKQVLDAPENWLWLYKRWKYERPSDTTSIENPNLDTSPPDQHA